MAQPNDPLEFLKDADHACPADPGHQARVRQAAAGQLSQDPRKWAPRGAGPGATLEALREESNTLGELLALLTVEENRARIRLGHFEAVEALFGHVDRLAEARRKRLEGLL